MSLSPLRQSMDFPMPDPKMPFGMECPCPFCCFSIFCAAWTTRPKNPEHKNIYTQGCCAFGIPCWTTRKVTTITSTHHNKPFWQPTFHSWNCNMGKREVKLSSGCIEGCFDWACFNDVDPDTITDYDRRKSAKIKHDIEIERRLIENNHYGTISPILYLDEDI